MIAQIMSDLHLGPGSEAPPPLVDGAELIVVAGDTCEGLVKAVESLRSAYPDVEIAMVAGNHEFYGRVFKDELEAGRKRAQELGVHLLENDTASIGQLRIIGATLWTDYLLFGPHLQQAAMRAAYDQMLDHKRIRWNRDPWQRFRPSISDQRSGSAPSGRRRSVGRAARLVTSDRRRPAHPAL